MCISLTRRTQILLDEDRYQRLRRRAVERNVSVAAVIRDAIDEAVLSPAEEDRRRLEAGRALLAMEPMDIAGVDEIKREIATMYDRDGAG